LRAAAHRRAVPRHGDFASTSAPLGSFSDLAGIKLAERPVDRRTAARQCAASGDEQLLTEVNTGMLRNFLLQETDGQGFNNLERGVPARF